MAEWTTGTPLPDLGPRTYQGYPGGLYLGGFNQRPSAIQAFLAAMPNPIQPLDALGNPDPVNGKIVIASCGMSNWAGEWSGGGHFTSDFMDEANADPAKNPQVILANGAVGGDVADSWTDPSSGAWIKARAQILGTKGVDSLLQVQGFAMKHAESQPWAKLLPGQTEFPGGMLQLNGWFEKIARAALGRNGFVNCPNTRVLWWSSRTHSYATDTTGMGGGTTSPNPEPWAYESGFAVQKLMGDQYQATGNLNYDPAKGPVVAPLCLWGPYLWATSQGRSDGMLWLSSDVAPDLTHPSMMGAQKVTNQLLAYFKTDPSTASWFLKPNGPGGGPVIGVSPQSASIAAGGTITFTASGAIWFGWNFDDGMCQIGPIQVKTFPTPGSYNVRVCGCDGQGNSTTVVIPVTVT